MMSRMLPNVSGSEVPTSDPTNQQGVPCHPKLQTLEPNKHFQAGLSDRVIDQNASGNLSGRASTGAPGGVPLWFLVEYLLAFLAVNLVEELV